MAHRTLGVLVLIGLAVLGLVLIWPQANETSLVEPDAATTLPADPARKDATVGAIAPVRQRTSAAEPDTKAPQGTARLVVQCVARSNQQLLAGVRVSAKYADVPADGGHEPGPGHASSGRPGVELLTDGEGRVAFEVEPGRPLGVTAHDQEHFVSQVQAQVPALAPGETRTLRLEHDAGESAHFHGVVVAREDGRPLGNAVVSVNGKPRMSTDSAGRFELDYAPHLVPGLRIEAPGFGPAALAAGPGHELAQHARRITLQRAAALVVALQVPAGQAAARVTLRTEGHEISQDQVFATAVALPALTWEASADAQWVCTFAELPPDVRLVGQVIGSTGVLFHAQEPIVLAPGERRRIEWDLRGCELVGHVYEEDGKAAPGITLWLLRGDPGGRRYVARHRAPDVVARATSAEDGSFRFAAVAPGTWILAPQPVDLQPRATPADAIASAPLEVTIRAGESRSVVDVQLARGLYIRGRLVAPDGTTGVQGAVSATADAGERLRTGTDAHGVFALGPLQRGTFSLEGDPYNTYVRSPAVAAKAGTDGVVLRARPGAEVAGKVIDGQSGLGVQAAITVCSEGEAMTMTRTQPDGTFRLDGFESGRYTLFASTAAGQAGVLPGVVLDPGAPAKGLEVVLRPGAKLRIRYEGNGVGEASLRQGGARLGGDDIQGGTSLTQVVPPGRIVVGFRYPGRKEPEVRDFELGAGEEREIVFKEPGSK